MSFPAPNYLTFLFIILFFFSSGKQVLGQENTPKLNSSISQPASTIIKTNLLSALWGPIPYTGEYRIMTEFPSSYDQSFGIGLSYLDKSFAIWLNEQLYNQPSQGNTKILVEGFRVQAYYRWYYVGKPHRSKGLYLSPHISFSKAFFSYPQNTNNPDYVMAQYFNINLLQGFQFGGGRFYMDVFSGLGYKNNTWEEHISNSNGGFGIMVEEFGHPVIDHLKFSFGMNFGISL